MRILIEKMKDLGLLKFELILGTLLSAAAMIALPALFIWMDPMLLTEPMVLAIVLGGMLFFGIVGYFSSVRPYLLYKKLPDVYAECDEEFFYIHLKSESKIPLEALQDATIYVHKPFWFQKRFLYHLLIYFFTNEYGTVVLEIPGYESYKMPFVAHADDMSKHLAKFLFKEDRL